MIPTRLGPNEKAGARLALPRMLLYNSAFPDQAVRAFAERLHTAGIEAVPSGEGEPFLQMLQDRTLPAEGYRIIVQSRGVIVEASTQQETILALTTTWKEHALHGSLPAGTFLDAPAFSRRGLLLDCARHFFPAEEIRRVLEAMALCKLNVFHWHLADDQGFRIETKAFPEINEAAGPYDTQAEIRDLVAYTADRGIEVIPEIDLPGHTRAILAGLPKLSCSGKRVRPARTGGIYKTILCPGKGGGVPISERAL